MAGQLGLDCSNNPLTSINFENYYKLEGLSCKNTLLTSLDISGNNQCESLQCSNNPNLFSLLIKDAVDIDADMGDMWYYFEFNNTPNLRYLCVSESRLGQAQIKLNQYGNTDCALNSYCDLIRVFLFIQSQDPIYLIWITMDAGLKTVLFPT